MVDKGKFYMSRDAANADVQVICFAGFMIQTREIGTDNFRWWHPAEFNSTFFV